MSRKIRALDKLKDLKKRIPEVEAEKNIALYIMSVRMKKETNNEPYDMSLVESESKALNELHAEKDWRRDTIKCIEYFFSGKKSKSKYLKRLNTLNFSIIFNAEDKKGFIDAESLIDDMKAEIETFWPEQDFKSQNIEAPDLIKQFNWFRQLWNDNKILAIIFAVIIIILITKSFI